MGKGCQLQYRVGEDGNDTLCIPDGGDAIYKVERNGVGGRGHGLWREGCVRG